MYKAWLKRLCFLGDNTYKHEWEARQQTLLTHPIHAPSTHSTLGQTMDQAVSHPDPEDIHYGLRCSEPFRKPIRDAEVGDEEVAGEGCALPSPGRCSRGSPGRTPPGNSRSPNDPALVRAG